jgi:hypothetical protein
MTTMQFINSIISWLQADPSHIIVLASALAALTPTPNPNTIAGRAYKVLDLFALNFLHAKSTGVTMPDVAQQVASILEQMKPAPLPPVVAPAPVVAAAPAPMPAPQVAPPAVAPAAPVQQ